MTQHRRVIVESPYAGKIDENDRYLRKCLRDCIDRGEAPIASHLLYPCLLKEDVAEERQLGIELGYAWWDGADCIVFYMDKGWSNGMRAAFDRVQAWNSNEMGHTLKHEFRFLTPPDQLPGRRYESIAPKAGAMPEVPTSKITGQPLLHEGMPLSSNDAVATEIYGREQENTPDDIRDTLSRESPSPVAFGEEARPGK